MDERKEGRDGEEKRRKGGEREKKGKKRRTRRVERYRNYVVTRRLMDALILERKRLTVDEEWSSDEKQPDGIEQWVKNFASSHFFLSFVN